MKNKILLAVLACILAACQAVSTPLVNKTPPAPTTPPETATLPAFGPVQPTGTVEVNTPLPPPPGEPVRPVTPSERNDLMREGPGFGGPVERIRWQPDLYRGPLTLPVEMGEIANPGVIAGLTREQIALLGQNGFTVLPSGEEQFADIRFSVADQQGQPYYLTTDAAYHALHVTFDETLKAIERQVLLHRMKELLTVLIEQVQAYDAAGTPLEEDTRLAEEYLAVALRLFDPQVELSGDLLKRIEPQIKQVEAGAGRQQSVLIPNFEDDYGAYKPVGHYAGVPALEQYFRGMTWLGRVSIKLTDPTDPAYRPTRMPLIITLALRQAEGAAQIWKDTDATLDFLIGPSDDPGPAQLAALMDPIYGEDATFADLADEGKWQTFLASVDSLPAPQINSTFLNTTADLEATRDWRLMGQRFTFDASIFQNLIYDKVGTPDKQRKFPTGPDVMAVFGSNAAQKHLKELREFEYANYSEQMEMLRNAAFAQPEEQWLSRFYTGWLYSFFPQVEPKGNAYPPTMRSAAWADRELNTALGSWAELKHDTVLYNKMPEFLAGGGPPSSEAPPVYVEPNPEVFYRLAYITGMLYEGLNGPFVSGALYAENNMIASDGLQLDILINALGRLKSQYVVLGDIAAKELMGAELDQAEYWSISECLGVVECNSNAFPETPPVPVIAAVSGAEDEVLEVAVGKVDRIYVVVPILGRLHVAQGGVFSYYEFKQPREDRMTDQQWRDRLEAGIVTRPAWTHSYLLPGGEPTFEIAFRAGDWYIITEEGGTPPLNVRAQPSKTASVVDKLEAGMYVHFVEGPVSADGLTWWKIADDWGSTGGWVAQNPDWYERAHGQ